MISLSLPEFFHLRERSLLLLSELPVVLRLRVSYVHYFDFGWVREELKARISLQGKQFLRVVPVHRVLIVTCRALMLLHISLLAVNIGQRLNVASIMEDLFIIICTCCVDIINPQLHLSKLVRLHALLSLHLPVVIILLLESKNIRTR